MSRVISAPDIEVPARRLVAELQQATRRGSALLLLPGGSALAVAARLWQLLPEDIREATTISLTDERFGPVGHANSNWRALAERGIDLTAKRHLPVLRGLDLAGTAADWGVELLAASRHMPIVALMGIGTDHHIGGIKPGSPAVTAQEPAAGYIGDDFQRLTITGPFFENITYTLVYAEGPAKRTVVAAITEDKNPLEYPSQLVKQTQNYEIYYREAG